jgi:hypothetical protein
MNAGKCYSSKVPSARKFLWICITRIVEELQIASETGDISVQDVLCKIWKALNIHLRIIMTQDKTLSAV